MITIFTIIVLSMILMQAFFTASEMALTSISRAKLKALEAQGDPRAARLNAFLSREGLYLGATLVGTNIAVVTASVLATRIFSAYFGADNSPLITTAVMVPVTLIFAEIVPKMIARQLATPFSLGVVGHLSGFYGIFRPLIFMVNRVARILLIPFNRGKSPGMVDFNKSDLKRILILGHETGEMEADEVELIHKVLDFGAKKVERIMVPMYRVSSIGADDTVGNLKRLVSLTGFSRVPVYRENKNKIAGIVNIYDILFSTNDIDDNALVEDFLREPVYVKREDGLDIALARLRHKEQPMGIVTERENSVVGIITIEDMLEEIVGEMEDTGEAA